MGWLEQRRHNCNCRCCLLGRRDRNRDGAPWGDFTITLPMPGYMDWEDVVSTVCTAYPCNSNNRRGWRIYKADTFQHQRLDDGGFEISVKEHPLITIKFTVHKKKGPPGSGIEVRLSGKPLCHPAIPFDATELCNEIYDEIERRKISALRRVREEQKQGSRGEDDVHRHDAKGVWCHARHCDCTRCSTIDKDPNADHIRITIPIPDTCDWMHLVEDLFQSYCDDTKIFRYKIVGDEYVGYDYGPRDKRFRIGINEKRGRRKLTLARKEWTCLELYLKTVDIPYESDVIPRSMRILCNDIYAEWQEPGMGWSKRKDRGFESFPP